MSKPSERGSLADLQMMILDQLTDAVLAIDHNRRIVFWNRSAERLCHLSACNALGKYPSEVQLSPWFSAAEEEAVFSALEGAELWRREAVRLNGNGNTIHIEQSITALTGPAGDTVGFLVVMRDITRVKRLEREQEQHVEALRRASDRVLFLDGLIPICSHCKQIRDQCGSWHEPDVYLREHIQMKFTHGICPKCVKRLHPEYFNRPPTLP